MSCFKHILTLLFYFFTDQRVASFCTLDDMQQAQGLEGPQELPLDESPTDGKDFLEATGYVKIKACFLTQQQQQNNTDFLLMLHVMWW